jgi:hypothetical protein
MSEEKIKEVKELIKVMKNEGIKRGFYTNILNFLKDEILELKTKGLNNKSILALIKKKVGVEIPSNTFNTWLFRNKSKKGGNYVEKKELNKKETNINDRTTNNNSEEVGNDDTVNLDEFKNQLKNLF